jgi:glycine/D-amino acid oxidase-like deaminating enzyme
MQMLRRRGHDLVLLHLLDDDELDFPFDGPTRFEGLELPDHIACNPRALRDGYLAELESFLAGVRQQAAAARCDYSLIRTSEPLDAALVRFLSRRASMAV